MGGGPEAYHLEELAIARRLDDPRRIMPPIEDRHRRILDVGCGAGQTLIASSCASSKTACGVDVDFAALRFGRQLNPDLHLVCAAGEELPFANECFDLVIARVALPYMHIPKALAEFARVSKAGGSLWLVLHSPASAVRYLLADVSRLRLKSALQRIYVLANTVVFHITGRLFPLPRSGGRYESCQTRRSIDVALQRAGYNHLELSHRPFFVASASKSSAPPPRELAL